MMTTKNKHRTPKQLFDILTRKSKNSNVLIIIEDWRTNINDKEYTQNTTTIAFF